MRKQAIFAISVILMFSTAAALQITFPDKKQFVSGKTQFKAETDSNPSQVTFKVFNSTYSTNTTWNNPLTTEFSTKINTEFLSNGKYYFEVKADSETEEIYFYSDNSGPEINLLSPEKKWISQDPVALSFNATDELSEELSCKLFVDKEEKRTISTSSGEEEKNEFLLQEGEHSWKVECEDEAGNKGESAEKTFSTDFSAPSVDILSPSANEPVKEDFYIKATSSDELSGILEVYSTAGDTETNLTKDNRGQWSTQLDSTEFTDGELSIAVSAFDRAGNKRTLSRKIIVDNTPPEVKVLKGNQEYSAAEVEVRVSAKDESTNISSIKLVSGNKTVEPTKVAGEWSYMFRTREMGEGEHSFFVKAEDEPGNINSSQKFSFTLDNTPPELSFTFPLGKRVFQDPVKIEFNTPDALSEKVKCFVRINSKKHANFSLEKPFVKSFEKSLEDGNHSISIKCYDKADNMIERKLDLIVDTEAPEAKLEETPELLKPEEKTTVSCKSQKASKVWMKVDGSKACEGEKNCSTEIKGSGEETVVKCFAADLTGNINSTEFTIKPDNSLNFPMSGKVLSENRGALLFFMFFFGFFVFWLWDKKLSE